MIVKYTHFLLCSYSLLLNEKKLNEKESMTRCIKLEIFFKAIKYIILPEFIQKTIY